MKKWLNKYWKYQVLIVGFSLSFLPISLILSIEFLQIFSIIELWLKTINPKKSIYTV